MSSSVSSSPGRTNAAERPYTLALPRVRRTSMADPRGMKTWPAMSVTVSWSSSV